MCNRERTLEIRLRFGCIRHWRLERDFPGHAMDFSLAPPFLGCFHRGHGIANTAPGIIEMAEFGIGSRQT
jgi:hypothetical protein